MRRQIGFVGLGKLGGPCAEVLGRMHDVVGFDVEPGPAAAYRRVDTLAQAVRQRDFVFVVVPTPHLPEYDGSSPTSLLPPRDFDYTILKQVLAEIEPLASKGQRIVVVSTVLPGTFRQQLAQLLPGACLIYSPSFVAMGSVQNDYLNPDIVVIGTENGSQADGSELAEFYATFLTNPHVHSVTWEEAESIKIFYNTFISMKIVFANMIQDVAHQLGNMNVDRVTSALMGANRRITSGAYLRAGMGDGGPCHPRDNIALRDLAERMNLGYDLFSEILRCRESQAENLAKFLVSFRKPVAMMGKAYKPAVPYTDGSSSLLVAHFVRQYGDLAGFVDPMLGNDLQHGGTSLTYLLAHDSVEFHRWPFLPGSVIVDPWRSCPPIQGCEVVHYGNNRRNSAPPVL